MMDYPPKTENVREMAYFCWLDEKSEVSPRGIKTQFSKTSYTQR